jgi:hypothetical protein
MLNVFLCCRFQDEVEVGEVGGERKKDKGMTMVG